MNDLLFNILINVGVFFVVAIGFFIFLRKKLWLVQRRWFSVRMVAKKEKTKKKKERK